VALVRASFSTAGGMVAARAEQRESEATSSKELVRIGLHFVKLAGKKTELEAQKVEDEVARALGEADPATAARVEQLMEQVRKKEDSIMKMNVKEAVATTRLAKESSAHASHTQHRAVSLQAATAESATLKARVVQLEKAAVQAKAEAKVVTERTSKMLEGAAMKELSMGKQGRNNLLRMKGIEKKVEAMLARGRDVEKAAKVKELLHKAEKAQYLATKNEFIEAKRDLLLSKQAEHVEKKHVEKVPADVSMLASAEQAGTFAKARARFARQASKHVEQSEHMFFDSDRVLGEVKNARLALGKALAGTSVDAEIGQLLKQAQGLAGRVVVSQGKEWVAASRTLQEFDPKAAEASARALQKELRGQ